MVFQAERFNFFHHIIMSLLCCIRSFLIFLGGLLLCTILLGLCWVLMLHLHYLLPFCGFLIHRNKKASTFVHFLWLVQKVWPFFVRFWCCMCIIYYLSVVFCFIATIKLQSLFIFYDFLWLVQKVQPFFVRFWCCMCIIYYLSVVFCFIARRKLQPLFMLVENDKEADKDDYWRTTVNGMFSFTQLFYLSLWIVVMINFCGFLLCFDLAWFAILFF